jgi:4-carboxymuconolactone decarboxylase
LGALFDTWLRAPTAGQPAAQLGEQLRFFGTLDDSLREMVTLTVAAHWGAAFEFWAHAKAATSAGLSEKIIDALRDGRTPPLSDKELLVYSAVRDLLQAKNIEDAVYDDLRSLLGEPALVELVMVVGYYSMVCISMRAFAIGLSDDVEPF